MGETQRRRWVVTPADNGIDGMLPTTLYGDDIGPFDTREEAVEANDRLLAEARAEGNFYAGWAIREVTKKVNRWE